MTRATILCPDLAVNALGRAWVLARLLQPRFDVRIVGPCTATGIWRPLRDDTTVAYEPIPMRRESARDGLRAWRETARRLEGDLLYVSKPFATSLWAARRFARRSRRPVLVDIDDWETGILRQQWRSYRSHIERLRFLRTSLALHHRTPWNAIAGELNLSGFPHRTVASRFLQARFGGQVIWHARDEEEFSPDRADGARERERQSIPADARLVVFLGTPRAHKGLEQLIDAVAGMVDGTRLAIVGVDEGVYSLRLRAYAVGRLGDRIHLVGPQPLEDVPRLLAMADVVAIPQLEDPAGVGQTPAKVFDAMALAKPIVSTTIGDLPEILSGAGRLVAPGDVEALRSALQEVLSDPGLARRLGRAARLRFEERYSMRAVRPVLWKALKEAGVD
jgi:glycosyltransferase involved in cell wall biosynthesis